MIDTRAAGGVRGNADFLTGDGEMARLVREKDWSSTPLGPIDVWPQSLRTTVSLCLASNFPINIIWGPSHTQIYNDGYRIVCGDAHPRALGEDYSVTWASAWPVIGEPFARALGGETSFLENQRMFLTRNGYLEETFFTFSTSPVRDESGRIGGLFHPVTETTASMLAERRTRSLRDLNAVLAAVMTQSAVSTLALRTLSAFNFDLPFLLFYQREPNGRFRLDGCEGIDPSSPAAPPLLEPGTDGVWPVDEAVGVRGILQVDGVAERIGSFSAGPYEEPPDTAFLLPVGVSGSDGPAAIVIVGVSPRLPLNDDYRGYFELLASALTAAATTVSAREQERSRAEALAEIDRAKTTFFSNVSHEFRTPLTLMLGPLEDTLADGDELSSALAGRIALIHRNGLRLLKLVNSLLDFSRIEAGRMQGHFEPTDIVGLTADLASNFRSATDRAGLRLIVEIEPLNEPVYVDRQFWEKVVLNLLSNAFKFTLSGEIRIGWHRSSAAFAEMYVSDTGTGIPEGELPRLFERFHRVQSTRGRSFEGSGIGLALVVELVKLHGGSVSVASALGRGSTFTVSLPLGASHLPAQQIREGHGAGEPTRSQAFVNEALSWLADADEHAPASAGSAAQGHLMSGRVLVADDNSDMRGYVVRLLRESGLEVHAVSDGQAALQAARAYEFDLILSDVMMPNLNGFELLSAVRRDPALQDASVILLSARAGEEARVEGLEAGADDYLTKPFGGRELVARVAGAIGLARGRRASQETLRQVQKMEALGRLTGGVAHDFNNLLTVIAGGLDLLPKQGPSERGERIVQAMRRATQQGASLTRQLLAFSRRQSLEPQCIDLEAFLERAAEMLDRTLRGDVAVEVHVDEKLGPVLIDPAGLELALLNLCVNARDAMSEGGTIRIRATNLSDGVKLEVIDQGKGMTADVAARAFEPFFTTKAIGSGSGLGLTQVYAFAHSSGGSVSIRSTAGVGTNVALLLPRASAGQMRGSDGERAVGAPLRTTGTVLLVEDNEEVAALTRDMLEQLGFSIVHVANAASALGALADDLKVDLVFSDILMPGGMNGVELARELRKGRPELPVLLTSGYTADALFDAKQARLSILPKPYGLQQLSAALASTLEGAAAYA